MLAQPFSFPVKNGRADISDAAIQAAIVDQNDFLLTSGVWGVGELYYVPPEGEENKRGQV